MAAPVVDAEYLRQVDRARRQLRALISNKGCAPIMLRLAYVLRTCGFRFFFFCLRAFGLLLVWLDLDRPTPGAPVLDSSAPPSVCSAPVLHG
jgi:hypothetical protein